MSDPKQAGPLKPSTSSRWSQALLAVSFLLLVASLARTWLPPVLSVAPGTQVTCAAPVWEAGPVFSGQSYPHEFVITNTGRTAVTVSAVTASCGCTTYSQELVGKRIEAGEKLGVPVNWNVLAQPGKQHKQIAVHFAEWKTWSLPLKIAGDVQAAYTLSTPHVSFGKISADSTCTETVTITFPEGSPSRRATGAHCSHAGLDVVLSETDDPSVQSITVRTLPPLTVGRLSTSVLVQTEQGSLVIPIVAAVEPPPGAMVLGTATHQ